jgi:xanthine dehydrogenase accessory factor
MAFCYNNRTKKSTRGYSMNIFEKAAELSSSHTPFAIATILSSSGSTPRSRAKMIVLTDGSSFGTIGGGIVESYVIEEAVQCIRFNRSTTLEYDLDRKGKKTSIEMDCGGNMKIFIESISPGPRLLLIGGGHVSLEIAAAAAKLGFRIAIVEERPEFCSSERFPMASELYLRDTLDEAMKAAPVDPDSILIIATSSSDERALRHFITKECAYIGMLGSRRKVRVLKDKLASEGVPAPRLEAVRAPIGLDLGAETPEEIAISILAEIMSLQNSRSARPLSGEDPRLVVVRGAGDIATGTICRLVRAGFEVVALETDHPTVIRRSVSFAQAIFDTVMEVEGITARRTETLAETRQALSDGVVPIVVDPGGSLIPALRPAAVVDAILAKKNLGTRRGMAPAVIGLGPGFDAGGDVDAVIETKRGHHLGRVILEGKAAANTGIPGTIGGFSRERVIHSTAAGNTEELCKIGDLVNTGDPVLAVTDKQGNRTIITAPIPGKVRGLIRRGTVVSEGFKVGDIDPRGEEADHTTVSDKAWAVAGGVLEALLFLLSRRKK